MFELDRIPAEIYAIFAEKGIKRDDIRLIAYSDRTTDGIPADAYLAATTQTLALLVGFFSREADGRKTVRIWNERRFETFPLASLSEFRVEELVSGVRFTAKKDDGETVFLASMTNFCRTSMLLFAKYVERLQRDGDFTVEPEDDPASMRCPKCGMRYPEKNRKICPKCMEKGKMFRRISAFFLRYKGYLLLSVLSLAGMTALSVWTANLSAGFFIDEVLDAEGRYYGAILFVLSLVLLSKVGNLAASIFNNITTSLIAVKVDFDLKKTIFGAIERLSLGFFTNRQTGGLMTQVNSDSETIYNFFCNSLPYVFVNGTKIAVLVVLVFRIDPLLSAICLASIPVSALIMRTSYSINRKLHARRYCASRSFNAFLSDELSGMRVVKAFAREREETERFRFRSGNLASADLQRGKFNAFFSPLFGFLLYLLGNLMALAVGGWFVIKGRLTYGELTTFTAYMAMIYAPLHFFFTDLSESTADCNNAMTRMFEILDAQPDVCEAENPVHIDRFDGAISFENVSFSYIKNHKVIDNVSFGIGAGQILGIVGHTGAGKSTLANLLIRLYDPESGQIRIDGTDIRKIAFADLYRNVAFVSQETYLFMGTIAENIRYARPDASYEEVLAASRAAGAHDFIVRLPDGYETKIGFGYQDLSGGERQRISIARAILRNPRILILDEATAAMDTETERRIQNALTELVKGKTTIMIAHRLSTLRDADKLVVIENGRVAEEGTHEELMAAEGVYHRLYSLQMEALQNAGIA